MPEDAPPDQSSWKWYMRLMNGLTVVMFGLTLAIVEVSFLGYADNLGGETAMLRAAIPSTAIAPMVTGALLGHWFHPGRYGPDLLTWLGWTRFKRMTGFVILLGLGLVVGGLGLGLYLASVFADALSFWFPGWVILPFALVMGCVLWPVYRLQDLRPAYREAHGLEIVVPTEGDFRVAFWILVAFAGGWLIVAGGMIAAVMLGQTAWGVVAAATFWLVFVLVSDVFLVINKHKGDTWSEQLRDWGLETTTLPPWVFGVLAGRWFHPFDGRILDETVGILVFCGVTVVVVGGGALLRVFGGKRAMRFAPPWAVTLLGIVCGALFVPAYFPPALTR